MGPTKSAKEFHEYYVNIVKRTTGKLIVKMNTTLDSSKSAVENKYFSCIKITQALHQLNKTFPQVIVMILIQLIRLKLIDY